MIVKSKLPDAEFDIMKALWSIKPPATAGMLLTQLEDNRDWKPQTLHTLLKRLEQRGFVQSEKMGKERSYTPLISRQDYLQFETQAFVDNYHNGSLLQLINTAYHGEALSDEDMQELINWLQEHKS